MRPRLFTVTAAAPSLKRDTPHAALAYQVTRHIENRSADRSGQYGHTPQLRVGDLADDVPKLIGCVLIMLKGAETDGFGGIGHPHELDGKLLDIGSQLLSELRSDRRER
jgi:hypothetical protein